MRKMELLEGRGRRRVRRKSEPAETLGLTWLIVGLAVVIQLASCTTVPTPVTVDPPRVSRVSVYYPPHCDDTSNCDREICNDKRDYAPPQSRSSCHLHPSVMECFRNCRDPAPLLECYKERKEDGTEAYCLLRYERKIVKGAAEFTTHLGLPCQLKCKVDAWFWNCVHACDNKGCFKSFRTCEREGDPPPCNNQTDAYWRVGACQDCYVSHLIEEVVRSPDCIIRYHTDTAGSADDLQNALSSQPNRCIYKESTLSTDNVAPGDTQVALDISKCVSRSTGRNISVVEQCYREELMKRQLDLCQTPEYTPDCKADSKSSERCHAACFPVLTKPYCHVPCQRNETLKKRCEDGCQLNWPRINCSCSFGLPDSSLYLFNEDNARFNQYFDDTYDCSEQGCFVDRIYYNLPQGLDGEQLRIQNCKSSTFVKGVAENMLQYYINNWEQGDPPVLATFQDDIGRLTVHYTYFECNEICKDKPANETEPCKYDCLRIQRNHSEMEEVCNSSRGNPLAHHMRSEITVYCMLQYGVDKDISWTHEAYKTADHILSDFYENITDCETALRDRTAPIVDGGMFFYLAAHRTYVQDKEWCVTCLRHEKDNITTETLFHQDDLDHADCALKCYRGLEAKSCPKGKNTRQVIRAVLYDKCAWKIDFSLSRNPYKIWSTYFDEIQSHDAASNLLYPNATKYLTKTKVGTTEGYYVFPYFVVVRPKCEDGYYDDDVYKLIASGARPFIRLTYVANTPRQKFQKPVRVTFQGALVNLERKDQEDRYLPANPLELVNETTNEKDGKLGCHLNLCYPAFVVPQMLLHIPIFQINVLAQDSFNELTTHGYSFSLHSRGASGHGRLQISDNKDTPTAIDFFPNRKEEVYEDTQLAEMWNRLPDSTHTHNDTHTHTSSQATADRQGPSLEHLTDHNCKAYKRDKELTIGGNQHSPLDMEDFMHVQYTHGNSPQVVMAGFYDPSLLLIGDPDFTKFDLSRWTYETSSREREDTPRLFHGKYACLSQQYKVGGFRKPIYSYVDRSDPDYWLQFYRMRYAPKNYENASESKAIFDAVALEDRIVLVTTGGLVSLYQNLNVTASLGKHWEVEGNDSLHRCFKIVRTSRRTQRQSDTIVAITYDYQVMDDQKQIIEDVNQQVWVGKYTFPGQPLDWQEIVSGAGDDKIKEERASVDGDKDTLGTAENLPDSKIIEIPVERREINPKSQIEAICYKAYRSNMAKVKKLELIEDHGWCVAVDATPVTASDSIIQVLVRMRGYFSGGEGGNDTLRRTVYFYVIASYNFGNPNTVNTNWQINSIIPRIPCQGDHKENIRSVASFHDGYFTEGDAKKVGQKHGCHLNDKFLNEENIIYLHGITYTKSYTQHLFLYGNKLLQSTDSGQTFVHLNGFPLRDDNYNCKGSEAAYHTIKLMTFDDKGHYAFLTNKRELWYGNLGSLNQIRLRPSDTHSMSAVRFHTAKEVTDAVPFSVFFDSNNALVEMVAVLDTHGTAFKIERRSINEKTMLRATHMLSKFRELGRAYKYNLGKNFKNAIDNNQPLVITKNYTTEFIYNQLDWAVFCPYASSFYYHNFSELHARTLTFSFPVPKQHSDLGNSHIITSLQTYQASTYRIVWNTFLNQPTQYYSNISDDHFKTWVTEKEDASVIGRMNFLSSDPAKHGILVLPAKYQRYNNIAADKNRIFKSYYLDYGVVVHMIIEYSVSNDFTFNPVRYSQHRLSVIDINVENSNGSLLQIDTERELIPAKASVQYVVHLKVKRNTGLAQRLSGRNGINIPVTFHLVGAFGNCVPTATTGIKGDTITTAVVVGCPSSLELVLDWNSTVTSIKFRDHKAHYGLKPVECYKNEPFCFYAKYPLILHFDKFDYTKQAHHPFTGNYIMTVIGGGYSRETLREFTKEEQQAYNVPGVSDVSLIWNEWDRKLQKKKERQLIGGKQKQEVVLTSGKSAIQWSCHTLSPCARVIPRSSMESVYYFKIGISNRGVDNSTLCLFEKEFIILLYGFAPSTEMQLFTTTIFYILILTLVYIAYLCARNNRKIWRVVTGKVQGWYQVVVNALPASWTKTAEESEEEAERQKRRDEIILSLQGHLNVPRLVHKTTVRKERVPGGKDGDGDKREKDDDDSSSFSSSSSYESSESQGSDPEVLPPVVERPAAQTWTDMIHEQVVSRRLATIIERNKREAEELRKKAALEGRHHHHHHRDQK